MFERRISQQAVLDVLAAGEVIEENPDDQPFPSRVVLGWFHGRPLHVVSAVDAALDEQIVITVYDPDPALWDPAFRRRQP
jgi:hypothetical protein